MRQDLVKLNWPTFKTKTSNWVHRYNNWTSSYNKVNRLRLNWAVVKWLRAIWKPRFKTCRINWIPCNSRTLSWWANLVNWPVVRAKRVLLSREWALVRNKWVLCRLRSSKLEVLTILPELTELLTLTPIIWEEIVTLLQLPQPKDLPPVELIKMEPLPDLIPISEPMETMELMEIMELTTEITDLWLDLEIKELIIMDSEILEIWMDSTDKDSNQTTMDLEKMTIDNSVETLEICQGSILAPVDHLV